MWTDLLILNMLDYFTKIPYFILIHTYWLHLAVSIPSVSAPCVFCRLCPSRKGMFAFYAQLDLRFYCTRRAGDLPRREKNRCAFCKVKGSHFSLEWLLAWHHNYSLTRFYFTLITWHQLATCWAIPVINLLNPKSVRAPSIALMSLFSIILPTPMCLLLDREGRE